MNSLLVQTVYLPLEVARGVYFHSGIFCQEVFFQNVLTSGFGGVYEVDIITS